jgi:lysophospholipase L1-like esterase
MDPFYICKNPQAGSVQEEILKVLPEYIAVVHEMAEKFQTLHIPLHDIFQQQLLYRPAETFCPEPVHPNPAGHTVIAHAWLNTLGW